MTKGLFANCKCKLVRDLALFRSFLAMAILLCSLYPVRAFSQNISPADTVDNDFVIASVLLADPGDILYQTVGHVALRMQCPQHNLDYVFSYESENVREKVLTFLAGKLKMGMFAIPYEEYLTIFREEHRGVQEYILNLPLYVKRNLWRVCDDHVAEGANLSYDYLKRGCAHSTLMMLKEGLGDKQIDYAPWSERIKNHTRRELTETYVKENHPWTWFVLNMLSNGSINDRCNEEDKIIMPLDLIDVLQEAKVDGVQLLSAKSIQILPSEYHPKAHWCSPLLVSIVLLVFTICLIVLKRSNYADYLLLVIQSLIGMFTIYLVIFSDLVCTESSMLMVPFNILPLLLWRWRGYWCLPYAIIIGIWIICALCWPYALTDIPYIVLSVALMASYINMFINRKKGNNI